MHSWVSLQQILTTVMTNIVVDMSTDHAKYNIDIKWNDSFSV